MLDPPKTPIPRSVRLRGHVISSYIFIMVIIILQAIAFHEKISYYVSQNELLIHVKYV